MFINGEKKPNIHDMHIRELLDEYTDAFVEYMNYSDRKKNPNWDFDTDNKLYFKAKKFQDEIYRRCGYIEEEKRAY